jgi:type VI secretion system protein ImpC
VFDEAFTVRRIAEEGIWLPALRPARDRWLDVSLVVDAGASMGVWRSTAEELRKLLEWMGAFRNVRVWRLDTDESPPRLRAGLRHRAGMPSRNPLELVDPSGRSLVLVLSDCVSAAWYGGDAGRLLETWGRRGPVVLLQVLPEHLWSRTALGSAAPVRLSTPHAAAPNARLRAQAVYHWPDALEAPALPVPVASLEPGPTAAWAGLVAGIGGVWAPGLVLESEPAPRPAPVPEASLPADVRVARFWQVASPPARRLAGLLAARQVHEAEVLLGGLLRVVPGPEGTPLDPDEVRYDFHEGVRSLLLDAVPTADALVVLEKVSSYVEEHLVQAQDFRSLLADPAAARGALVPDESPFARIAAEVLQRLGGDYARLIRSLPAGGPGGAHGEVPAYGADAGPSSRQAAWVPPVQRQAGAGGDADTSSSLSPAAWPTKGRESLHHKLEPTKGRESLQHKLDRVRRPRVQITYDVETLGAREKLELPFVVGVLADLSGHPREALGPLKERQFVPIDRDNFNDVLRKTAPRLALRVRNRLTDQVAELAVELDFRGMEDFGPAAVAWQVGPLWALLGTRQRLVQLLNRLEGNDTLENLLAGVLSDAQKARSLARELGVGAMPAGVEPPEPGSGVRAPEGADVLETAAPRGQGVSGLLGPMLDAARQQGGDDAERSKAVLQQFLARVVEPGQVIPGDVETNIKYWVAEVDKKLSGQVNEILHHPDFQRLEGTWRGLHYLVHQSETSETLRIRVLNVSKRDLFKDLERAVEFDQSALSRKVYEEEYGQRGGTPYGMLVGDYEFSREPEDISLLTMISHVAAAAHAPFVAGAAPKLFNFDRFTELTAPRDLAKVFMGVEYATWKSFRESEDSRYVALTLPHVLARLPYGESLNRVDEFNFEEFVDGAGHDKYLWMNAAWAYAALVTNAFARDSWFARIRGVQGGGKVESLPVHTFPTDDGDVAMKCPTEIAISDRREFELSNLGFLPLLHSKNNDFAVFMGAQSAQKPKQYFDPAANANAELSAKFNYLLCVSRFAHYLKVMARDKIGSFMEVGDCQRWLNDWISNYVVSNPESVGEATKAAQPLSEARVEVRAVKGKPGHYEVVAWLRPHFQLESLTTSIRLVAEVPRRF